MGSEGLREYGPPTENQNIAQALPDAITEQSFYVVDSSALKQQQISEGKRYRIRTYIPKIHGTAMKKNH